MAGEHSFRLGDTGPVVAEIRSKLAVLGLLAGASPYAQEPVFDAETDQGVRAFQQQRGITVDGLVGQETYRALDEARWRLGDRILTFVPARLTAGDDVARLQQRLLDMGFDCGRVDGLFGVATERALREFQRNVGIRADGTCGPETFKALNKLAHTVVGGRPHAMRESEAISRAGPTLSGKVIVIDPGDSARSGAAHGVDEDALVHDLAARIDGRLSATGSSVFLTRGFVNRRLVNRRLLTPGRPGATHPMSDRPRHDDPPLDDPPLDDLPLDDMARARFANSARADLLISLHVDVHDNPKASGCATYFYGIDRFGHHSAVGERLADLIQREVCSRTDLVDLRSHPKTWDLLRHTRMPAVRIELGYLSHAGDAARLSDPAFRDVLAEAIVAAVQRVYLPPEDDPATGTLRLPELRAMQRS